MSEPALLDHLRPGQEPRQAGEPLPSSAAEQLRAKLERLVMDNSYLQQSLNAVRGVAATSGDTQIPVSDKDGQDAGAKETIIAKVIRLNAENVALQQQLQAATAQRERELRLGQGAASSSAEEAEQPTAPPPPFSPAATAIAAKLAAATEQAGKHQSEVIKMHNDLASARQRAAQAERELEALRRLVAAREAPFLKTEWCGPKLSLHWSSGIEERWPHGPASSHGVEELRKALQGRNAELKVSPPPADWHTWLQLGLRRGELAHPAMLRLLAVGAERSGSYVGLLWARATAAA